MPQPSKTPPPGSVLGKLGNRLTKAFGENKANPVEVGNVGLPAGIEGGIAQLTQCKFGIVAAGKTNAGQPYFQAMGTVVSPTYHEGQKIAGRQTSIMEMICDTPGRARETVEDHVKWILNTMKLLGVEGTEDIPDGQAATFLEQAAADLVTAAPHFFFRTWSGTKDEIVQEGGKFFVETRGGRRGPYATEALLKKDYPFAGSEPRVQSQWLQRTDYTPEGGAAPGMVDETSNGQATHAAEPTTSAAQDTPGTSEPDDLDALAATAQGGDLDAIEAINAKGLEAGLTQEEIDDLGAWTDLPAMIAAKLEEGGAGDGGTPPDEPLPDPKVEDVFFYQVLDAKGVAVKDPKTKKAKPSECEVVTVDKKSKTVTLKDSTTQKPILGADKKPLRVKWDDLIRQ